MVDWPSVLWSVGVQPLPGQAALVPAGAWPPQGRIAGILDGKRVELSFTRTPTLSVPLEPPLDLGLVVQPDGVMPLESTPLGLPQFDALFRAIADEPERLAALLLPAVLRILVNLLERSLDVRLRDDALLLTGDGEAWLRSSLSRAVEVAHRIDGQRSLVPIPAPLREHRAMLGRVAAAHGLLVQDTPIRLAGRRDGVRISATLRRRSADLLRSKDLSDVFAESVTAQLDDALNVGLRIERAGLLTPLRALLPQQTDHRLGDAALDAALWIRTSRPELLPHAFDAEARRDLATLVATECSFVLDDRGLSLDRDLGAPAELLGLLEVALRLPARLGRAVRTIPAAPAAGPFR